MTSLENARHEKFAQALAAGMTVDAAYGEAGYAPNRGNASRLNTNESVVKRVQELQHKTAAKAGITLEALIELGKDIIREARGAEDYTAASSTFERLAKISGHWIDRSESKSTVTRLVSDRPAKPMDEQEWLSTHAPGARPN